METKEESKVAYRQPLGSHSSAENVLTFRIFHCSSQDTEHIVTELTNIERDPGQIKGWQS